MATSLDIDEMRRTLTKVSVYRQVRERVRASASGTLFSAIVYLGFGFLLYNSRGAPMLIVYAFLGLGVGELLVGLWKKIAPSPECILADAILEFAFIVYLLFRVTDGFAQAPKRVDPIILIIGGLAIYHGLSHLRGYFQLRRIFVERPTAEHIAYVDDLKAEVANGNPEKDPTIVEIPTKPFLKAKLLGDVAFFLDDRADELFLCARDEMEIARQTRGGVTDYELTILREAHAPCEIDAASWDNYAKWKTEGGEPPPPVTIATRYGK